MPGSPPLPPHLERFVRQQIAAGRYHSADEVILDALRLLEGEALGSLGQHRQSARPPLNERWETPGEWLAGAPASTPTLPPPRRPRGLLADLRRGLSSDEVRDARHELWAGLRPGGA